MVTGRFRSLIATTMVVALAWFICAPVTHAQSLGSWGGRVYQPDRVTPREGVVVSLINDQSDLTLRADPTRSDGAFTLDSVPVGAYALRVETPEGVFVSTDTLQMESGPNTPMALALNSQPINAEMEHGLGEKKSKTTEYIVAGVVALFALFIILELTDDATEQDASVS
jgi:hypothetical protein